MKNEVIEAIKKKHPNYKAFTEKCEILINDLLESNEIEVHSITSRTKTIESISDKINLDINKYNKIDAIHDISGLRIICLLFNQVDKVAKIIEDNFFIDKENSIDKKDILDPDRFGYLSLHYIAKLTEDRIKLTEYKRYENYMIEIQIRSILQHTWAEIEHDLGYKTKIEIPKDIKRKFFRLAGLLEIADNEFDQITNILNEYKNNLDSKLDQKGRKNSFLNISIDKESLKAYLDKSSIIQKIHDKITIHFENYKKIETRISSAYIELCDIFNIKTINDLNNSFHENEKHIIKFADHYLSRDREKSSKKLSSIDNTLGLYYLLLYLSGKNNKVSELVDIFKFFDPDNIIIDRITKTFAEIKE